MKLGVIGTNWISKAFIEAAESIGYYRFTSVLSREKKSGESFCELIGHGQAYDDVATFSQEGDFDVAYVASPNSVHFEQCKQLIKAGKHVIVEKPAFSNLNEHREIFRLADEQGVFVFEAARHIYEQNFAILKKEISYIGKVRGANFTYMKYSSRYDQVLVGKEPNIFSLKYSGGALYDLGIYLIYVAIDLFGLPKKASYICQKISTGVDGVGTILFEYPDFLVTMQTGKICDSTAPSEIFGEEGTLTADSIEYISKITRSNSLESNLAGKRPVMNMTEAASSYYQIIKAQDHQKYQRLHKLSAQVHWVLEDLRKQNMIIFDSDLI